MGQFFSKLGKDRLYLQRPDSADEGSSSIEPKVHTESNEILLRCTEQLSVVKSYTSPKDIIVKALSSPSDLDVQREALQGVSSNVAHIKQFYVLAKDLGPMMKTLLCQINSEDKLLDCEALARRFAKMAIFALEFDQGKMKNAEIQNDFSFFKRTLAKFSSPSDEDYGTGIDKETMMSLSLFLPKTSPMLSHVASILKDDQDKAACASALASIANVSSEMVKFKRVDDEESVFEYLKLITSAVILYDLVAARGAFAAGTQVKIKQCIQVLVDSEKVELVNCIKFLTPNFKSNTTPSRISAMLN